MSKYVVAKKHEVGRTWRTVIMDISRRNEIVWQHPKTGWNKHTRAKAHKVAQQMQSSVDSLQRMMRY